MRSAGGAASFSLSSCPLLLLPSLFSRDVTASSFLRGLFAGPSSLPLPPEPGRTFVVLKSEVMLTGRRTLILSLMPSWPSLFHPNAHTLPSLEMANECAWPAAALTASPMTRTGFDRFFLSPMPNCPAMLNPQLHIEPLANTSVWNLPTATPVTPSITLVGLWRSFVSPTQSWPYPFQPNDQADPSFFMAKDPKPPAETAATPYITNTGSVSFRELSLPSCPYPLLPAAHRLPSPFRISVWCSPAAMSITPRITFVGSCRS